MASTLSLFKTSSTTQSQTHTRRSSAQLPPSPFATSVRRRPSGTTHSTKYWYEDGSVIFLVQTVLYKVHKSLMAQAGERFADVLARPPPGGGLGTEEDPIILTDFGVSSKSFDALLSVVYISVPYPTFGTPELVHMLRLSSLFRCHTIRAFAIETLSGPPHACNMSPPEMLRLAKECNVSQWVVPPLLQFARLRTVLPVELGAELLSRIAHARDVLTARRIGLILEGDVDLGPEEYDAAPGGGLPVIPEHPEHDGCGDQFRRELTRLHSLPAEEVPFPPETLLRSLPQLRGELCERCVLMPMSELESRVREWLDLDGDLAAVEGILVGKT